MSDQLPDHGSEVEAVEVLSEPLISLLEAAKNIHFVIDHAGRVSVSGERDIPGHFRR
jgi:predicted TIM-barrel fold metal-dependent hydrolase